MALESPLSERYVVYSVDKEGEVSVAEENHVLVKDVEYPSLKDAHLSSDRESFDPSVKVLPYWSCKGRCCCLWNFFVILALSGLCTVVILAHNRVIDIRFSLFEPINHEEALSSGTTAGNASNKGAGQVKVQVTCIIYMVHLLSLLYLRYIYWSSGYRFHSLNKLVRDCYNDDDDQLVCGLMYNDGY